MSMPAPSAAATILSGLTPLIAPVPFSNVPKFVPATSGRTWHPPPSSGHLRRCRAIRLCRAGIFRSLALPRTPTYFGGEAVSCNLAPLPPYGSCSRRLDSDAGRLSVVSCSDPSSVLSGNTPSSFLHSGVSLPEALSSLSVTRYSWKFWEASAMNGPYVSFK